ncbi:glycosyltransferase family 39 protein [Rubinisphaera sp.]|uniref:ArnT family glycosyltransferase n=1 Tax=Rubinisphaera sp. TaxID=2024857 RepID=UPI000C0FD875|nr:glycosyltransferase family 39 protein [Rubinisphaera sp.]MBV09463.1 hypothetical protein [Rubinisphaera sp.]HCS52838.1 hypothetical protein [Planctomycetaceae bacterium]|tara:strand:- start:1331 stop:3268 length:1938 start_codon:yes stop_codon:yes gene_type:complete
MDVVSETPNSDGKHASSRRSIRRFYGTLLFVIVGLLIFVLPVEWRHYSEAYSDARPLVSWMANFNADTSLYLFWLLALPFFWLCRLHLIDPDGSVTIQVESWLQRGRYRLRNTEPVDRISGWIMLCCVGLFGLLVSLWLELQFGELPPAFHDEYSYLFQAETYLQGRLSNPRFESAPELFDQMHILNDSPGHFVSRYFPGTGLWMTPFVALGIVYTGYAIAQAIVCMLMFGIARDLGGNGVGLLTGLLCAVLPGVVVFSNLLLSHHPCLLGLGLFIWSYHRYAIGKMSRYAILAGIGLGFAMWCRPMTAFGIALPYAIHFLIRQWREFESLKQLSVNVAAMGGPILIALLLLLPYNLATTGHALATPYQEYTKLHTPRHVYGFYNGDRGDSWIAEQTALGNELPVIEHYDNWAENLTPSLAWTNVISRLLMTGQMTIGILPGLATVLFFCSIGHRDESLWWLIGAAALSLHVVHIPYWYDGIMHWHYVFESAPLVALMFARSLQLVAYNERILNHHWLGIWWAGLAGIGLLIACTTIEPFWQSTAATGFSEVKFARSQHQEFNQILKQTIKEPAVVFMETDPENLHINFILNSPTLDDPVLRAHWMPNKYPVQELVKLFPTRNLYHIDLKTGVIRNLRGAGDTKN